MKVKTSNKLLDRLLINAAKVVHGLGTTFPYNDTNILIINQIDLIINELDLSDENVTLEEIALIKAVQRMISKLDSNRYIDDLFCLKDGVDLAHYRDYLNFSALAKAVSAFVPSEPKVDHLLPTVYLWQERLPDERRFIINDSDKLHFRVAVFANGRPMEREDSRLCREFYGSREAALNAVDKDNFGGVYHKKGLGGPYQVLEQEPPKPYLYILMRNDLQSLNAGKAVAQGTHAANQMVYEARKSNAPDMHNAPLSNSLLYALDTWEREANGFGTCITLSVNEEEMRDAVASAQADGVHAAICHDPTYPLLDGKTLHLLPVDTCAYIFDWQHRAKKHTGDHPLMP